MQYVNTEAALLTTFKRFMAAQPETNRLFTVHHLEYKRRDEDNLALFKKYVTGGQQGTPPTFYPDEFWIEIECIDAPEAIHNCTHALVQFAIARGMVVVVMLKKKLSAEETTIPTDAENYCIMTYRLTVIEEDRDDVVDRDTLHFVDKATNELDPNAIEDVIEQDKRDETHQR